MSPTQEQVKIPDGWQVTHRATHDPRNDERPMVRTRDGHVLALLDAWRPDWAVN